jgi:hypothetical protein
VAVLKDRIYRCVRGEANDTVLASSDQIPQVAQHGFCASPRVRLCRQNCGCIFSLCLHRDWVWMSCVSTCLSVHVWQAGCFSQVCTLSLSARCCPIVVSPLCRSGSSAAAAALSARGSHPPPFPFIREEVRPSPNVSAAATTSYQQQQAPAARVSICVGMSTLCIGVDLPSHELAWYCR